MLVGVWERGLFVLMTNVVVDVVYRTICRKGVETEKQKIVEPSDSRKSDVERAVSERAVGNVDRHALEGLTLRLVGRDSPAKFQRELVHKDLLSVSKVVADGASSRN